MVNRGSRFDRGMTTYSTSRPLARTVFYYSMLLCFPPVSLTESRSSRESRIHPHTFGVSKACVNPLCEGCRFLSPPLFNHRGCCMTLQLLSNFVYFFFGMPLLAGVCSSRECLSANSNRCPGSFRSCVVEGLFVDVSERRYLVPVGMESFELSDVEATAKG